MGRTCGGHGEEDPNPNPCLHGGGGAHVDVADLQGLRTGPAGA